MLISNLSAPRVYSGKQKQVSLPYAFCPSHPQKIDASADTPPSGGAVQMALPTASA